LTKLKFQYSNHKLQITSNNPITKILFTFVYLKFEYLGIEIFLIFDYWSLVFKSTFLFPSNYVLMPDGHLLFLLNEKSKQKNQEITKAVCAHSQHTPAVFSGLRTYNLFVRLKYDFY